LSFGEKRIKLIFLDIVIDVLVELLLLDKKLARYLGINHMIITDIRIISKIEVTSIKKIKMLLIWLDQLVSPTWLN